MTQNNKPEWFEIVEQDGPAQVRKVSKSLPLSAVLAATLILGVGAVVGQGRDLSPATATENTTTSVTATALPSGSNSTEIKTDPELINSAAPALVAGAATTGLVNPAIAQMPTGGDDEDDEYEDDEYEDDDDNYEDDEFEDED